MNEKEAEGDRFTIKCAILIAFPNNKCHMCPISPITLISLQHKQAPTPTDLVVTSLLMIVMAL